MEEGKGSVQRTEVSYLKIIQDYQSLKTVLTKDSCCKHLSGEATKTRGTLIWLENQAYKKVNVIFTLGSHLNFFYCETF